MAAKPNVSDAVLKYRRGVLYRDGNEIKLGHVVTSGGPNAKGDVTLELQGGGQGDIVLSKLIQFNTTGATSDGVMLTDGGAPAPHTDYTFSTAFKNVK